MAHGSMADSRWQLPSSVVRVTLHTEPAGSCLASTALSALEQAASLGILLVDSVRGSDILLLVGTTEWAEGFLRQVREAGEVKPIVVLAENVANARILDAGADDCLASPFDPAELLARIRAVARRAGSRLSCGAQVAADGDTLRIRLRDVEARVSRKQFEIFTCLAERRERWVHSDEIIAEVCGTHHGPETSLVRVQIHALRKALGPRRECIRGDGHKRYMLTLAEEATTLVVPPSSPVGRR